MELSVDAARLFIYSLVVNGLQAAPPGNPPHHPPQQACWGNCGCQWPANGEDGLAHHVGLMLETEILQAAYI